MNYEGIKFLLKLYNDLEKNPSVKKAGSKYDDKDALVARYLQKLQNTEKLFDGSHEELEKYIKNRYYDKYVIKEENIPDNCYKKILKNKNLSEEELNNAKHKEALRIIEEQKRSLDEWIDYLMKENTQYPMWVRYWAFRGMLEIGDYNSRSNNFRKRNDRTTQPFIELNKEVLDATINIMMHYHEDKEPVEVYDDKGYYRSFELDEEELNEAIENGSFKNLYSYNMWHIEELKNNLEERNNKNGVWKKFKNGDSDYLVKILEGNGIEWDIADIKKATKYLSNDDNIIEIYFTKDSEGKFTIPRILLKEEDNEIEEIRGIGYAQNMEDKMLDELEAKVARYYTYNKRGMRYTQINNAIKSSRVLSKIYENYKKTGEIFSDDFNFIHGLNHKNYGNGNYFGTEVDPRTSKLRNKFPISDKKILLEHVNDVYFDSRSFIGATDEIKADNEFILQCLQESPSKLGFLRYIDQKLLDDKDFIMKAMELNKDAFDYASERLKEDQDIVILAINKYYKNASDYLKKEWLDDKDFMMKFIQRSHWQAVFKYDVSKWINDKDFMLEAIRNHGEENYMVGGALLYEVGDNLRDDEDIVLAAIQYGTYFTENLKYASDKLKRDSSFMNKAIEIDALSLSFSDSGLRENKQSILKAINSHRNGDRALEFASKELKNDRELVLVSVNKYGSSLEYASDELKNDKEVVMIATKNCGSALAFASDDLRNDMEIVLNAVNTDGLALYYASDELKNNKEIVLSAIKENPRAIQYASEDMKNDREIVLTSLTGNEKKLHGVSPLRYVSEDMKKDREVVLTAVKQENEALKYADEVFKNDPEIMLETLFNQKKNGSCYVPKIGDELANNDEFLSEVSERLKSANFGDSHNDRFIKSCIYEMIRKIEEEKIYSRVYDSSKTR